MKIPQDIKTLGGLCTFYIKTYHKTAQDTIRQGYYKEALFFLSLFNTLNK